MSALAVRQPLAVMLTPAVGLLGVFIFAPMALTIWLAFQEWSTETGFGEARFVGLDNFQTIFGSTSVGRDFKGALFNTAIYSLGTVAAILPLRQADYHVDPPPDRSERGILAREEAAFCYSPGRPADARV